MLHYNSSATLYASGFVCSNNDGVDEQEEECAGSSAGVFVRGLGPFQASSLLSSLWRFHILRCIYVTYVTGVRGLRLLAERRLPLLAPRDLCAGFAWWYSERHE